MELDAHVKSLTKRAKSRVGNIIVAYEVKKWPEGRLEQLLKMRVLRSLPDADEIRCPGCTERHMIEPIRTILPNGEPYSEHLCSKEGLIPIPEFLFKRWEIVIEKLEELEKSGQPGANFVGMGWQEAQIKAEALVDEKGYLGFGVLAKAVGCSGGTLRKVITQKSDKLKKAKEDYETTSKKMKAVGLTAKVIATYETSSEPKLTEVETEEILAEILDHILNHIEDKQPGMLEKTKSDIAGMDSEAKQSFAAYYKRSFRNQKSAFNVEGPKKPIQHKQA